MNKNDRLQQTITDLKSEFYGLDSVIDRVIETITPWYLTPELLERPVVISLWGLTGTGKSSLVRRLIDLLDLTPKTLFINTGELDGAGSRYDGFSAQVSEFFSKSYDQEHSVSGTRESVFVLDEFQHTRSLDERGSEIECPGFRGIWNLLDSGYLDLMYRSSSLKRALLVLENLEDILGICGPGLGVESGKWSESSWGRVSDLVLESSPGGHEIFPSDTTRFIRLTLLERAPELAERFRTGCQESKTLGELVESFGGVKDVLSRPIRRDFSRSLVFVLGNLDEAFGGISGNLDPDLDPDVLSKIVSQVGPLEIKRALTSRFRAEQVGRLGNNLIVYPALRSSDFRGIIDRELRRVSDRFGSISGGTQVKFEDSFKELLYSEGVSAAQGARPLLSTIEAICLPRLSEILTSQVPTGPEARIEASKGDSGWTVKVYRGDECVKETPVSSVLREGRGPKDCKKIVAHAIHEAGHVVMTLLETGKYPEYVLAASSAGGGYTYGPLSDIDQVSADNRSDVRKEVRTALAGVAAESLFFDADHCTLGGTSDFRAAWEAVARPAYRSGFFEGVYHPWTSNIPGVNVPIGSPVGPGNSIDEDIQRYLAREYEETRRILGPEKDLIREIGKILATGRPMTSEDLKRVVEGSGSDRVKGRIGNVPPDSDYYWKALEE